MEVKKDQLITVFTSTFRRIDQIKNLFFSLQAQTCKNFLWFIVDDGSNSSELRSIIKEFIDIADFDIIYVENSNVGKYNELLYIFKNVNTEFLLCVDDDDILTENAINQIREDLTKIKNDIGLIYPRNNKVDLIEDHIDVMDIWLYFKKHIETLIVFKTEVIKNVVFPTFGNEKFTSEEIIYNLLSKLGKFRYFDIVICKSQYLQDGLTNNLFFNRRNNPESTYALFMSRYKFLSKYNFFVRKILRIKCLTNYYSCIIKNKKMKIKIIGNLFYFSICYVFGLFVYFKKIKHNETIG